MGVVVKPFTFTNGTDILASEHNANFDTLYDLVNGNIESANIASGAVGESELAASAVTNAKVSSTASIALSKLAAMTASKVPVSDGSGFLTASSVTSTELGHLSGVTSAIQTQVDSAQADATQALADAASKGEFYSGYVNMTGAGDPSVLPTGWSFVVNSTGIATVTHNLGLAGDMSDCTIAIGIVDTVKAHSLSYGVNSFTIRMTLLDGSLGNGEYGFILHKR